MNENDNLPATKLSCAIPHYEDLSFEEYVALLQHAVNQAQLHLALHYLEIAKKAGKLNELEAAAKQSFNSLPM